MNRSLAIAVSLGALTSATVATGPVRAQGNAPKAGGNTPAAPAAMGGTANGPAAAGNAPATGAASNAPAAATGNAPAAPAAGASKSVSVRVPGGGEYTVYIKEAPAAMKSITEKGDLEVPAGIKSFTVYVLDKRSGYASRKTVEAGAIPAELAFSSPDFKLIQRVEVLVTGKGDQPIAQGLVTLTDSGKNVSQKPIMPTSQGRAAFDFVMGGEASVAVTPEGGSATTKTQRLELAPGQTSQTITVGLPEVTNVVAGPAPATNAPEAAANAPASNAPAPAAGTTAAPVPAAPTSTALPTPPAAGPMEAAGNFIWFLFQWIILIAVLGGVYVFARKRGITVDMVLKKLGIQPDTVVAGGSLAGANVAAGVPGPGVPPPPPPVVSDPNQCQFCGQQKDAAGNCACSALPARNGASNGGGYGAAASSAGAGPRLVGMQGTYMGSVFPVSGAMTLGREPMNPIPLDRDTTTSRRHAEILADGGGYRIRDLGSANGTFVNGGRISAETPLNPGDEVSVGGTRFRFEV